MKKKCLYALLTAMMITVTVFVLTGCGKSDDTLTIMGKASDMEKSYMVDIFEQYETATGNKLDIITYEDSDFETAAAESFRKGDAPDILMHFHNAELNCFNIEDDFCYLEDEAWVVELTDSARAYCTDSDGHLLGLPFWEDSVSGCYYNKTLLDSLGLKPATTQAEFDALCQAIADKGYTPICWPADGCSWMPQFGLDPVFADDPETLEKLNSGEISYADIPAVTNMADWIAGAAEKGWFGKDFMETGWDDISGIMGSGEAVMTFIWDTWFYTDFEDSSKYSTDDFALMPIFMNTAESGTYEDGNLNMMMVNKNSEKRDEALEFLAFCASEEHYNKAFDGIATESCFKNQTTNIQSPMVTNAVDSIMEHCRAPVAVSQINGYSAEDVVSALNKLMRGKTDTAGCIGMMDKARTEAAENAKAAASE